MRTNLSDAVEDYLKAIYELTLEEEQATTNQIAACMEVTPASVTGMLKRLAAAEPPLLEYHKHRGARLTPAGRQVALEITRHHRLLESFLHESLGYRWDQVHAEADRLEHVISEDFEERIAQALGDPLHDPHGDPIPARDLSLPPQTYSRLGEIHSGQVVVRRVRNDDPELLRYLEGIGLVPGAELNITGYSSFDGNLQLQIHGQGVVLGPKITLQVYVEAV